MTNVYLVVFTLILSFIISSTIATGVCRNPFIEMTHFKISCDKEPNFSLVKVECLNQTPSSWRDFPEDPLNLTNVHLVFVNCMLSKMVSIYNLTQSLGLDQIGRVQFKNLNSPLYTENLKGLKIKNLEINNSSIEELPEDLLYDVEFDNLYINGAKIKDIPKNFFKHSVNLKKMEIVNTKINFLRRDIFLGLKELQELLLFDNGIENIEQGTFDDLERLSMLDLSINKIKSLPTDIFKKLVNLKVLNLSGNELHSLPTDLLQIENSKLEKFRFNYNQGNLEELPKGFFQNLTNLSYVELMGNGIKSIPEDIFYGASSLNSIDLHNNKLTTLPAELFKDTNKLKVVKLSNNNLEELPNGLFDETNVEKVFLHHNYLKTLLRGALSGLNRVKQFDASHNNLEYIDPQFCELLKKVERLDLSFNMLTLEHPGSQHTILTNCSTTTHLYLARNNITRIFHELSGSGPLKEVYLEGNHIKKISAWDLQILNSGSKLNLTNNEIATVDLADYESLLTFFHDVGIDVEKAIVDISINPLHCDCHLLHLMYYFENKLPSEIYRFVKLLGKYTLKCSSPPKFENLSILKLKSEDLSCLIEPEDKSDACRDICTCWDYPAIETLVVDCSSRNLSTLPENINNPNKRYIELNLSNNNFNEAPTLDVLPVNLTLLDLSSNNLSTINYDLSKTTLRQFILHDNRIKRLESTMITQLIEDTLLQNLSLHGNLWICNCETRDLLELVQKRFTIIQDFIEIKCNNIDKYLSSLTLNELCSSRTAIIISVSLGIAIFGIALGFLIALYFKYQREIKIWLYAKGWCLWLVTEAELDKDKQYDAFISFSHKDEDFVVKNLVKNLEECPKPYKLCLHYRDFVAGEWIPAQIAHSVEESRRTVVVLSPNFLESVWGRMEFRTAHCQALREGRARVIVILYGDIGDTESLDPELKAYLSMNTYVKWGDPWFWDKLRYALPHRYEPAPVRRRTRSARLIANYLENQHQQPVRNGKYSEVIPMPKISPNDSTKLLDSGTEDDKTSPDN